MSTSPTASPSSASASTRSTSATPIGCTRERIHSGTGCTSRVEAVCRMISKDVDPAPITTPARSDSVAAVLSSRIRSTSSREAMCGDSSSSGTSGTSPDR